MSGLPRVPPERLRYTVLNRSRGGCRMSANPTYLVQTSDGALHGYWDPIVLRCDLARDGIATDVKLYRLIVDFRVRYVPMSREELKAAA